MKNIIAVNRIDKAPIQEKAKIVGGIKLFAPDDAKSLTSLLVQEGKKILGIDGIFLDIEGTRPSMEDTLLAHKLYDEGLSDEEVKKKIFSFIDARAGKKNLLFEVVFDN